MCVGVLVCRCVDVCESMCADLGDKNIEISSPANDVFFFVCFSLAAGAQCCVAGRALRALISISRQSSLLSSGYLVWSRCFVLFFILIVLMSYRVFFFSDHEISRSQSFLAALCAYV